MRIGDVIKEVKRQIGSLQRQAGKARRYQALHADLRVLETHHARKELNSLESEFAACREEIDRLTQSEHSTRGKIDNDESALGDERRALDRIDAKIADSHTAVQRLDSEIAAHRNRIEFNKQRADELAGFTERARRDIAEAETKRGKHAAEIEQTNSSIAKIQEDLKAKEAQLIEMTALAGEMHKDRTERDGRLQALYLALSKSESRISALNEELSGTNARRELTAAQIEQLATEIKKSSESRGRLVTQIAGSLSASRREPADVEASLGEKAKLLSETEQHLASLERPLAEKRSRLEVLRQLNQQGEGLAQGSQALLKGTHGSAKIREAIAGSLVAQLDVDPKFIQAIEAALGRNLHAIILKDPKLASEIIETLKKNKLGQAALLVLELMPSEQKTAESVLPKGALAWAFDKLKVPQPLEPLVRQLLGNVAIFSDLEHALESRQGEPAPAMATLAGEYISAEGIVFGGSTEVRAASLLERKAEIADLAKQEAALVNERDSMCVKRDQAKTVVEVASRLQREVNEAGRKIDNLQSEKAALERQIATADERIAHLERKLQEVRDGLARQKTEFGAFEATQRQTTSREEELTEQINQLRLAIATDSQRNEHLIARREPMSARDAELVELITVRNADIGMSQRKLAAHGQGVEGI